MATKKSEHVITINEYGWILIDDRFVGFAYLMDSAGIFDKYGTVDSAKAKAPDMTGFKASTVPDTLEDMVRG